MDISSLHHPKESLYKVLALLFGSLFWLAIILSTMGMVFLFLIPVAILLWIAEKTFQTIIYGHGVEVNDKQFSQVDEMVKEVAAEMGITDIPTTFVFNAEGMTNALAVKFMSKKYILLYSSLIDLMWDEQGQQKLRMVIAHELAHHAAGHVNFWRNLIIKPALFMPFLGAAYYRSCEYTADRIAAHFMEDEAATVTALISLASGSRELMPQISVAAFVEQEQKVPALFGFIQEIYASHPRMTRRVIAILSYYQSQDSIEPIRVEQVA